MNNRNHPWRSRLPVKPQPDAWIFRINDQEVSKEEWMAAQALLGAAKTIKKLSRTPRNTK